MGLYINNTNYDMPYINGKPYNAYLNGKKVWVGWHVLSLSPTSLSFNANGGTGDIGITSSDIWTATTNASSVSPVTGKSNGTTTVTVPANNTFDAKTFSVTVKNTRGGDSASCSISQSAKASTLTTFSLSPTTFGEGGGTITYSIDGNDTFTVAQTGGTILPTSGTEPATGTATIPSNTTFVSKSYTFKVTNDHSPKPSSSITISQSAMAATLEISYPTVSNVAQAGSSFTISVTSNDTWKVTETGGATLDKTTGSGNADIKVTIPVNNDFSTKSYSIGVQTDHRPYTVKACPVVQAANTRTLSVSPTTKAIGQAGSAFTLTVTSNDSWTLSETGGASVSPSTGTGNGSVTVTIPSNSDFSSRSFTIKATNNSVSTLTASCSVSQSANTSSISVSPTTNTVGTASTSYTLNITSNDSWTAAGSTGVSLSKNSGYGNDSITVTIPENSTFDTKTHTVTVTASQGGTATCTTTQSANTRSLSVSPTTYTIPSTGGYVDITVTANDSWKAAITDGGGTLSKTGGTGNDTVRLTVDDNTGTSSRDGVVTFTNTTVSTLTAKCSFNQGVTNSVIWSNPAEGATVNIAASGTNAYGITASTTGYAATQLVAYISTGITYNQATRTAITLTQGTNQVTGSFTLPSNTTTNIKNFNVIISGA
jgi:hypothetical protein